MITRCTVILMLSVVAHSCFGQGQSLESIRLNGYVHAAAVSPDGRYIAVNTANSVQQADGSWDNAESVQVFEPATAKVIISRALERGALVKNGPLDASSAFIGYCNQGKYLVVYDGNGAITVLDASSYSFRSQIDLSPQTEFSPGVHVRIACSGASDKVVIALKGGRFGTGLVKVVELASGEEVAARNENRPSDDIKSVSIAQDGSKIAILLGNALWPLKAPVGPNIEVLNLPHLGLLSQFSTGDASSDLQFDGNTNIATIQGAAKERFSGKRGISIWNAETGVEVKRLVDAHADVSGSIGSSADGRFVLGYIPELHSCAFCNGLEGKVEVKKQQFAIWDTSTGKQVFRSENFGPVVRPFQPQCTLSQSGDVVMVYWPSTKTTPKLFTWAPNNR